MDGLPGVLTILATVGCGLAGGVFFAFSSFVMPALRRLPPASGLAAMQSINRMAPTPVFLLPLFGTLIVSAVLAVSAARALDGPAAAYRVAGTGLYLVVIGLTVGYHVPRNDRLARLDPNTTDSAGKWRDYLSGWTAWNHVRTLSALAACGSFALALLAD